MKKLILSALILGVYSFITPIIAQHAVGLHFAAGKSYSVGPIAVSGQRAYYSLAPGFDYQYTFSDKLAFYGSIGLLSTGKLSENDDLRWPSETDGSGNYIPDPSLPHKLERRIFQLFFAVQGGVRYYLTNNRIRLFLQPYLEADIFLSNRMTTLLFLDNGDLDSKTSSAEPYSNKRKVVFAAGLGFGGEIDLGDQFSLYLIADGKLLMTDIVSTFQGSSLIPAIKLGVWYKI